VNVTENQGHVDLEFDTDPGPELEGNLTVFVTSSSRWRRFTDFERDNPKPPAPDREDEDDEDDSAPIEFSTN
jgi:hypothetical protein